MKISMKQLRELVRESIDKQQKVMESSVDDEWLQNAKESRPESFADKAEKNDMTTQQFAKYVLSKTKQDAWKGSNTTVNQAKYAKSAAKVARTRDNKKANEDVGGLGEIEFAMEQPKPMSSTSTPTSLPTMKEDTKVVKMTGSQFKEMVRESVKKNLEEALASKKKSLKIADNLEEALDIVQPMKGTSALELSKLPEDQKFRVSRLVRQLAKSGPVPSHQLRFTPEDDQALDYGLSKGFFSKDGPDIVLTDRGRELYSFIAESMIADENN